MAKTKNKKKLADTVRTKKTDTGPKTNPFEVKINRKKHDVIGQKRDKETKGAPGVSRFKANKMRKETLLVEYKNRGKKNKFHDKRFAESNPDMTADEKMLERFALERKKGYNKSMYSLNEDEVLTHYGQSLSEIEKFDDPDGSDDEDDPGKLAASLVREEHFGGGFPKKSAADGKGPISWKQRMEDLIVKDKMAKYEIKTQKEKSAKETQQLDDEWKSLMHVMTESKRNKNIKEPPVHKSDDYDIMVRELAFEVKGQPSSRLKTEEEIAKEEKERLEKLEADRIRRMKGITEEDEKLKKSVYRSADDLDDGLDLGKKNVRFEVAYADGDMFNAAGDQEEEENKDEEEDEEEEDEDAEEDDEESDDAMEHTSDLESDDGAEMSDTEQTEDTEDTEDDKPAPPPPHKPVALLKSSLKHLKPKPDADTKQIQKKKKQVMEKAEKELPYTFDAPETYEDLLLLLEGHTDRDQLILIDRLQKLYHPSLGQGNKLKLQTLYALLVEYYCDLALQDPPLLVLLDALIKPLYQLTQSSPIQSGDTWCQLIRARHLSYSQLTQRKGGRGVYPGLDMLLSFKLISALFPTSDFHHPVVTPTMLFMSQILAQCQVQTPRDAASGLMLCAICLQYVSESKRFIPEVINFLQGVLFTAADKQPNIIEPVCPPFKPVGKHINLLKLEQPCKSTKIEPLKIGQVFSSKENTYVQSEDFKVLCVYQCLKLLIVYMEIYGKLPAARQIFDPVIYFLRKLPVKLYPTQIKAQRKEILKRHEESGSSIQPLVMQKNRPKPLKTFEPKFNMQFDVKKKAPAPSTKQEKQMLVHMYKKEMKGAVRQLRQDNLFLAREKLDDQMQKDAERKRKVNKIYADLATQQGEHNAMKRFKESSKFT